MWLTLSSYASTMPVVLTVRDASTGEGISLTCVRLVVRLLGYRPYLCQVGRTTAEDLALPVAGRPHDHWHPHICVRPAYRVGSATSAGQLSEGVMMWRPAREFDVARADPTEQEVGNCDVVRADPTKQELGNCDVVRVDPIEQELGNRDIARADPTEQELGNWDVARVDPTKQELGMSRELIRPSRSSGIRMSQELIRPSWSSGIMISQELIRLSRSSGIGMSQELIRSSMSSGRRES
ncbi:hypothetical protein BHM03_00007052 [Ensete ventricosum]|uniref:Uncharacterized protein n=1 Tax=Ensete ventricosum TaxID=4639 RepID=A0A445MBW0_ENSVE|nr:hypothetical protein BHM03_00007052 [Ensete ventricosum]